MRAAALALGIAFAAPAYAQMPPAPSSPPAAAPAGPAPATPRSARETCRESGSAQGLRGPKLGDHVTVCLLEARLACTKDAIAKGVAPRERPAVIRTCLGGA